LPLLQPITPTPPTSISHFCPPPPYTIHNYSHKLTTILASTQLHLRLNTYTTSSNSIHHPIHILLTSLRLPTSKDSNSIAISTAGSTSLSSHTRHLRGTQHVFTGSTTLCSS
jgi:hypothetical protein